MKYAVLLLSLVSQLAHADLIEKNQSEYWNVDGLAHYVRSKENERFSAQLVSIGQNRSVVAFSEANDFCYQGGETKKVKVHYQWVKYVRHCSSGNGYWIPQSQRGIDFVKQQFSANGDVIVIFSNTTYSFTTKKFTSVKQRWEYTLQTLGDAL